MQKLHHSFRVCEKLRKHIKMLLSHGCMYNVSNHNLLFHASCPLNADGSLKEVEALPRKEILWYGPHAQHWHDYPCRLQY